MVEFDTISKSLIRTYPDGFLAFLLGQPNATVVEMLNPEQPKTQIMDSLLRVHFSVHDALERHGLPPFKDWPLAVLGE